MKARTTVTVDGKAAIAWGNGCRPQPPSQRKRYLGAERQGAIGGCLRAPCTRPPPAAPGPAPAVTPSFRKRHQPTELRGPFLPQASLRAGQAGSSRGSHLLAEPSQSSSCSLGSSVLAGSVGRLWPVPCPASSPLVCPGVLGLEVSADEGQGPALRGPHHLSPSPPALGGGADALESSGLSNVTSDSCPEAQRRVPGLSGAAEGKTPGSGRAWGPGQAHCCPQPPPH